LREIDIRRARTSDATALTRIAHAAKRHWRYADEYMRLWADDLTVTAELIATMTVFCAVQSAQIVGFYALSADGGVRELEHMWVAPEHIGTGIGTRLLAHALDTARSEGAIVLRIAADPHAEAFYLKSGARRVDTVPSRPSGRTLPLLELDV
jgi:GNAT superfamily N-acetyltransferase